MNRMYVVLTKYLVPRERIEESIAAHADWVAGGYSEGRILVSGRRHPPVGGLLVVRSESVEEVEAWIAGDPLVVEGLVEFEIFGVDATDFPKRSHAFDLFVKEGTPMGESK